MDHQQFTLFLTYLETVPHPRKARGKALPARGCMALRCTRQPFATTAPRRRALASLAGIVLGPGPACTAKACPSSPCA